MLRHLTRQHHTLAATASRANLLFLLPPTAAHLPLPRASATPRPASHSHRLRTFVSTRPTTSSRAKAPDFTVTPDEELDQDQPYPLHEFEPWRILHPHRITSQDSTMPPSAAPLAPLPTFSHVVLSRSPRCPSFISLELNDVQTFNSLTPEMFSSMAGAVRWCAKEPSVHAVVFSGRGRGANKAKHVFCSGMGMSKEVTERAFSNEKGVSVRQAKGTTKGPLEFIGALIDFPKLLVAAVNGHAFGMAVTMLPLFDFVYALPNLTFRTPFAELGVCAEGCSSVTFPAILGPGLSSKMLYYAEPQTSETLLPSGFITEIVAGQDSATLPGWVLNHLCDRLGTDGELGSSSGSPSAAVVPDPQTWRNLSLQSIIASKELVMHKERRRFLHEVNAKELQAVARMVGGPEFPIGLRRFVNKQMAKKQGGAAKL